MPRDTDRPAELPAALRAPNIVADPRFARRFRVTLATRELLALVEIRAAARRGAARLLVVELDTARVLVEHQVVGLGPRAAGVAPLAGPGAHAWVRTTRARVRLRGPDPHRPSYLLEAHLPGVALEATLDVGAVPTPVATLHVPAGAGAMPRYHETVNLAPSAGHLRVRGHTTSLGPGGGCLEFACGDLAGDPAARALAVAPDTTLGFSLVGASEDPAAAPASVYWAGRTAHFAHDLTLSPPADVAGRRRSIATRDGAVIADFSTRVVRDGLLLGSFRGRVRDDSAATTDFDGLPGLIAVPVTPWKRGRSALPSTPLPD